MDKLKQQVLELLDDEKKVLHKIYAKWIDDHAYLWGEFEDLERLREILLVIIKLFYEEHKRLKDINQVDYEEFRKDIRKLLTNHDALLQKARKAQVDEIEFFGLEKWFDIFKKDIEKINQVISEYEKAREIGPRVYVHHIHLYPDQIAHVKGMKQFLAEKVQRKVGDKILNYSVINGEKIKRDLPYFWEFCFQFHQLAEALWGGPLVFLSELSAVNINFVGTGGQQGFHTDRNEVTILLYLSTPKGGALEYIDTNGKIQKVPAEVGKIVGLVGANIIRHRVTPVEEGEERIALVASFGLPRKNYSDPRRDQFLYTNKDVKDQKVFE